jgi:hypothetical protein
MKYEILKGFWSMFFVTIESIVAVVGGCSRGSEAKGRKVKILLKKEISSEDVVNIFKHFFTNRTDQEMNKHGCSVYVLYDSFAALLPPSGDVL